MSLFGEKCVRCGKKRTKETFDGLPTCEACEQTMLAKAKAESESAHRCSVDGAQMTKDLVLNIVIDRCPECGGVWLDGGELELIRSAIAEGVAMDLAKAMVFPG